MEKHKARVIDKHKSLHFPKEGDNHLGVAVLLLDGWDPEYRKDDDEEEEKEEPVEPPKE